MTIQNSPYLRQQRNFPNDSLKSLSVENDRAYIDIASKVNDKTIGIFGKDVVAITGEQWFIKGSAQRQQTLRKLFIFTNTNPIAHDIDVPNIDQFTRMYGQYTDGSGNWYGLIAASTVAIAGQITFYVTPTEIIFVLGAGAPTLEQGNIVLEWLAVV